MSWCEKLVEWLNLFRLHNTAEHLMIGVVLGMLLVIVLWRLWVIERLLREELEKRRDAKNYTS